jgi:hypothetical protein
MVGRNDAASPLRLEGEAPTGMVGSDALTGGRAERGAAAHH